MPVIIAQALAEKGALDGVVTGLSNFFSGSFDSARDLIEARPYLLLLVAVVFFLLLKKRR